MDADREQLAKELVADGHIVYRSGRANNLGDIALSVLTVVGSLVATVLSELGTIAPVWVAVAAATPAACVTIQRAINPRGRSGWHFTMGSKLRALELEVRYTDKPLASLARKRGELDIHMDTEWQRVVGSVSVMTDVDAKPDPATSATHE